MCGISGAMTTRADFDPRHLVERIVENQWARGPDAQAIEAYQNTDFRLVLGHNRLSIIDLSEASNQPMMNTAGDLSIVYNGEIYNYIELRAELMALGAQFRTRGDTEVILAAYRAWGDVAFERFTGMFALALYDAKTRELILARDRFGVKPLYYWTDNRSFAFASTPTVIAAWAGLKPDMEYVTRGLRFKYYEDESSTAPYSGLMALEPSHLLKLSAGGAILHCRKQRYYDLGARVAERREEIRDASPEAMEERLLQLLRNACAIRMRSDVPVGISVSGGVDSSSIAALIAESHPQLAGYSFSHPDALESEGPLVADLARATKITAHYVWPAKQQEITDLFWRTLEAQGAPFPSASILAQYAVFQAARADGVKVLLGGQGGDEAFMGYRKFFLFYAISILRERRVSSIPHFLLAALPLLFAVAKRAGMFWDERKRYSGAAAGMGSRLILPQSGARESMGLAPAQTPQDRQILDVTRYSLPTLLRYEDRNSMGNSVESRLPFMDQRIIEFGIALPQRLKLDNGFGKAILRKAMRGRIPESIRVNRDKRGFDVNQRAWIEGGLGTVLRGALEERGNFVKQWLPQGESLAEMFSDTRLANDPQAFKEAVSLIWMADRC